MQACACFEHSNFFKVNVPAPRAPAARRRPGPAPREERPGLRRQCTPPKRRTTRPGPKFDYERFNCNNFNIRYWSWNYRGCWHQTCPPIVPRYTNTSNKIGGLDYIING